MRSTEHNARGFSLMELTGGHGSGHHRSGRHRAVVQSGMDATILVTQSSEMQQGVRSTLNLVAKDVSMAGSGLPSGGIVSALWRWGGALVLRRGCRQRPGWPTTHIPLVSRFAVTNYMFGIIPGPGNGMELGGPALDHGHRRRVGRDHRHLRDYAFPLNQYTATIPPAQPEWRQSEVCAACGALPAGFPAIQSPTGIQVGDLILCSNTTGNAVGEVTGIAPGAAGSTNITFANGDPLKINQSGAAKRKHQVHHSRRATSGHPDMGDHLFHRSSRRRRLDSPRG